MPVLVHFRRKRTADWYDENPVLMLGEVGYDIDLNQYRIGDGVSPWLSTHQHAAISAGTPAGTGSSTSVVQPYIVVYMWERTA